MGQPYVGEVRLVGFNYAPVEWAFCQGQLLAISQNTTLFQLVGTTYGGDGQSTFGLPDLRGRVPIHQGSNAGQTYTMGSQSGAETATITSSSYPTHSHAAQESNTTSGATTNPQNSAAGSGLSLYSTLAADATMASSMVSTAPGGSQPHNNIQPYQVLNWIISLYGVFPSQS
jgi:microcystin-dependent protein